MPQNGLTVRGLLKLPESAAVGVSVAKRGYDVPSLAAERMNLPQLRIEYVAVSGSFIRL